MRYYKEKTIKTEAELKKEVEEKEGGSSENGDVKKEEDKSEPKLVWIRKFKGSILVVFKTVEQAKAILEDNTMIFLSTPIVSFMNIEKRSLTITVAGPSPTKLFLPTNQLCISYN